MNTTSLAAWPAPLTAGVLRWFPTLAEAGEFMEIAIDRPVMPMTRRLDGGIELRARAFPIGPDVFCNMYDIAWNQAAIAASLHVSACPAIPPHGTDGSQVTASAGFFYLADLSARMPRQASLNLAVSNNAIASLPVTDREAVTCRAGTLAVAYVRAEGLLTLGGTTLTWTGSRTGRRADCYAYGNGNAIIRHQHDSATGTVRVLDEQSMLTPPLPPASGLTDIGFTASGTGFDAVTESTRGRLDICGHDLVLRCPADHAGRPDIRIHSIGCLDCYDLPDSAVSVGPPLDCPDFAGHPVNRDPSLGSRPPFADVRMARLVLYADLAGRAHLRLFDGRPGSSAFPGITPAEARDAIAADTSFQWGCFLDPGQTAKLWVTGTNGVDSYGNRHYLRWPQRTGESFGWIPDEGRPVASFITIR